MEAAIAIGFDSAPRKALAKRAGGEGGDCESSSAHPTVPVPWVARAIPRGTELGSNRRALAGTTVSSSTGHVSCLPGFWEAARHVWVLLSRSQGLVNEIYIFSC